MTHILDRPVFSALTTRHAALSEGGALARRYDPTIVPFAAARDDSAEAIAALGNLARPGERLVLLQADAVVLPPGFAKELAAEGVQMVLTQTPPKAEHAGIERLDEADATAMLDLATLTKPGPFTLRAQALGEFFGVRIDGRLAAMAGERMKPEGYAEISGVCVHPDFRGHGLARRLSIFVADRILARGETPILHAFASNAAARRLYESIGFELRTMMQAAVIRRADAPGDKAAKDGTAGDHAW